MAASLCVVAILRDAAQKRAAPQDEGFETHPSRRIASRCSSGWALSGTWA